MTSREQYSTLKKKICQLALKQPFSIQEVKDFYKCSINSNRSLSKVINLDGVFRLLEERHLLSESNITALLCLGKLLNNPDITQYVQVYSNNFLSDSNPTCAFCGLSCNYEEHFNSSSSIQQNQRTHTENCNKVDDLGVALINLSQRIGREWKTVLRDLDMDEKTLDEICKNNTNVTSQAQVAFAIWRTRVGADASVSMLDAALETRYNKNRGLGVHLRQPVSSCHVDLLFESG